MSSWPMSWPLLATATTPLLFCELMFELAMLMLACSILKPEIFWHLSMALEIASTASSMFTTTPFLSP